MNLIDFITLMLVNLVAGLVILAGYVYWGLDDPNQKRWASGFAITGLVALVTGFRMTLTWPITGAFNIAYGEMTVLFGVLFTAAALNLALGWDLLIVAVYGFFAGLAATTIGARFIDLSLSKQPLVTGIGFILTGLGGVFAAPTLYLRSNRTLRLLGAVVLLAAAFVWAITAYSAYWSHLESFAEWQPLTAR